MNYFVLLDNGQRFGPANVALLNQWAAEGRLGPNTRLEEEGTMRQLFANQIPGLQVGQPQAYAQPPGHVPPGGWSQPPAPQPYQGYYRGVSSDNGANDLVISWVCTGVSLLMCFTCPLIGLALPIVGLVFAQKAQAKQNPGAGPAKICAVIMIVLAVVMLLGGLALMGLSRT